MKAKINLSQLVQSAQDLQQLFEEEEKKESI